jgi:hypothetical protein
MGRDSRSCCVTRQHVAEARDLVSQILRNREMYLNRQKEGNRNSHPSGLLFIKADTDVENLNCWIRRWSSKTRVSS